MNPIVELEIPKPDEPGPDVGRAPPDRFDKLRTGMGGIARPTDAAALSGSITGASRCGAGLDEGMMFRVWLPMKQTEEAQ